MEISNYGLYISEREGFNIVESDKGFATYKITGDECYIRDIYVRPEFRDENIASEMADKIAIIAKEKNCTHLSGSVDTNANGATISIKVLLAYGFKVLRNSFSMILFVKEL
jgi:ribosomal protein S18 acetylase RimI-like enzyme